MDQFVFLISFFVLAAIGTAGSNMLLPAEVYWYKVLPNTPMPNALTAILHPDHVGIDANADNLNYAQYYVDDNRNYRNIDKTTHYVDDNRNYRNIDKTTHYVDDNRNYKNIDKKIHKFHDESNIISLFFLEKDLQPGATKSINFITNPLTSTFVPRQVANAIPFSSAELPKILHHFSIKHDTIQAATIKNTLDECEMPEYEGEHKFCATSLESLVESSMLMLGTRNVQALSTTVSKEKTPKQTYKVASSGLQRLPGSATVACHPIIYPFTVYYCHSIKGTKAYKVALIGNDGTKVEAVVVCHTETATWDPEHVAFQVLKVKPGTLPICHILTQDSLLWTPSK